MQGLYELMSTRVSEIMHSVEAAHPNITGQQQMEALLEHIGISSDKIEQLTQWQPSAELLSKHGLNPSQLLVSENAVQSQSSAVSISGNPGLKCKDGVPLNTCTGNTPVKDASLCYKNCRAGYEGVAHLCWPKC